MEVIKCLLIFLLIGAFNPVENNEDKDFNDSKYYLNTKITKYSRKFSSALLDRIDILNYVPRLNYDEIENKKDSYDSKAMKENVLRAREIQKLRFKNTVYKYNSDIKGKDIFEICRVSKKCSELLKKYYKHIKCIIKRVWKSNKIGKNYSRYRQSKGYFRVSYSRSF